MCRKNDNGIIAHMNCYEKYEIRCKLTCSYVQQVRCSLLLFTQHTIYKVLNIILISKSYPTFFYFEVVSFKCLEEK